MDERDMDLAVAPDPWAGAVLCHPHPDYGGDRHNIVVDQLFRALGEAGATVLRFDFRSSDAGMARDDVVAGLDRVAVEVDAECPLWLVGYSFGADIALGVDDDRVAGWVAVAPPLQFGPPPRVAAGDPRPVLALAAAHDQFNPPERLRATVDTWPDTAAVTVDTVTGADHFMAGAAARVATAVLAWLHDR